MSHRKGSTEIVESIEEFISYFIRFPLSGFYARGEPREYDTLFLPSIWRKGHSFTDKTTISGDSQITVGEIEALKYCQKRFLDGELQDDYFGKFINDPSGPIDKKNVDFLHWAALSQHYNESQCHPTRLIDITRDPLVALYFAVNKHEDESGFVYYFKDNFNEILPNTTLKCGGTYLDILEVSNPIQKRPCQPNEQTLAVARTPFPNRRVEAQRGAFCWIRKIDSNCYRGSLKIEIPSGVKTKILDGLKNLNYDDYTMFPSK